MSETQEENGFESLEDARAAHHTDPEGFYSKFIQLAPVVKPDAPQAALIRAWHQMHAASLDWARREPGPVGFHQERQNAVRLLGDFMGLLYDRQIEGEDHRPLPSDLQFTYYELSRPFMRMLLPVPGGHRIEVKLFGNPNGLPALSCHPGPGQGITPGMNRVFDPRKWLVVAFGQRGSMGCEYNEGGGCSSTTGRTTCSMTWSG